MTLLALTAMKLREKMSKDAAHRQDSVFCLITKTRTNMAAASRTIVAINAAAKVAFS